MGGVGQIASLISHHLIAQMPELALGRLAGRRRRERPFSCSSGSGCSTAMESAQAEAGGGDFFFFLIIILNESYHCSTFQDRDSVRRHSVLGSGSM